MALLGFCSYTAYGHLYDNGLGRVEQKKSAFSGASSFHTESWHFTELEPPKADEREHPVPSSFRSSVTLSPAIATYRMYAYLQLGYTKLVLNCETFQSAVLRSAIHVEGSALVQQAHERTVRFPPAQALVAFRGSKRDDNAVVVAGYILLLTC